MGLSSHMLIAQQAGCHLVPRAWCPARGIESFMSLLFLPKSRARLCSFVDSAQTDCVRHFGWVSHFTALFPVFRPARGIAEVQ